MVSSTTQSFPHLDNATVARLLPLAELIDKLPSALLASTAAPVRQRVDASGGRELLVMPALSDAYAGVKLLTIMPGNAELGLGVIQGLYVLFDFRSGKTLATMDADELTARRTAAVSAVAARHLAQPGANRLLLVGTGHLIPYLAEAHCGARPIMSIAVWGRNTAKAEAAARRISQHVPQVAVTIVADLRAAVAEADIVSAATRATDPVILGDWLRPGQHIDLVGGYRPDMREIDDAGIRRARIFVDTREGALAEAGDLAGPIARGVIDVSVIAGDLSMLAAGAGRLHPDEISLFKSVGTAAADLATASIAFQAFASSHGRSS